MITDRLPRMLTVRAPRESCLAFYAKFKRFEVDYLAATNSSYKPSIKIPKNLKVIIRSFYPELKRQVNNLSLVCINDLEELVKKTDIVNITDTYYSFNSQAVKLANKYGKPIVTVIWTTIPNHVSSWLPPYSFFTKNVLCNTNLFILRNKTAYKFTDSIGIDRKKTAMIYKGVDLKHFYPKKSMVIDSEPIIILYVGIYHPSKGLNELLEAFEKLCDRGLPVELHFAGKGEMEALINEKTKTLPVFNHGFVSYALLGDLYRRADIFCSPSKEIRFLGIKIWEEYFSYTLMEAQASGLPIVATKIGGILEEIGGAGILVDVGNVNQLYLALEKLVNDKSLRIRLGKIARKRAKKYFDAEIQAEKTESEILKRC